MDDKEKDNNEINMDDILITPEGVLHIFTLAIESLLIEIEKNANTAQNLSNNTLENRFKLYQSNLYKFVSYILKKSENCKTYIRTKADLREELINDYQNKK